MIKRYYRQNFSRLEDKRIVSGDSMEPEFHSGEIAWVSQQDTLCDGEIGIFGLNNEAYIKKLKRYADRLYLVSLNSKYSPIEIKESDRLDVFRKANINVTRPSPSIVAPIYSFKVFNDFPSDLITISC